MTYTFGPGTRVPARGPDDLQLTQVVTAIIPQQKGSQVMKELTSRFPLDGLQHLKRICKADTPGALEVILCPVASGAACSVELSDGTRVEVSPKAQQYVQTLNMPLHIREVPHTAPLTKAQWQEWCELWPMPWRVPDGLPVQEVETISDKEQHIFETNMRSLIELTAGGPTGSAGGPQVNAACIVDPKSQEVLGWAIDQSHINPLHHPVMLAVEQVACRDRQLWPCLEAINAKFSYHHKSMGTPADSDGQGELKESTSTAKRARLELTGDISMAPDCEGPAAAGSERSEVADSGPTPPSHVDANKPYLCTGYDCYVVQEPCVMCAMALVHSRIRRVIYCQKDPSHGALGSTLQVHGLKGINHRYDVYHLPWLNAEGG